MTRFIVDGFDAIRGLFSTACVLMFPACYESDQSIELSFRTPLMDETAWFQCAPHGAGRPEPLHLEVGWDNGAHVFVDDPQKGLAWTYCGYDVSLKVHLVVRAIQNALSGVLIDDMSGMLLPGGATVKFAPDGRHYLAFRHRAGELYPELALRDRRGRLLWHGPGGVQPQGAAVGMYFEGFKWTMSGRLEAQAVRGDGGRSMGMTLEKRFRGGWSWARKRNPWF